MHITSITGFAFGYLNKYRPPGATEFLEIHFSNEHRENEKKILILELNTHRTYSD